MLLDAALSLITGPLAYGFMQRGLLATILVGIICSVIGAFVVLKGLAFIGDALAHASFAGVAVAFIAGFNIFLGAAVAAVLTSFGIGYLSRRAGVSFDTAIGILFSGMFALGIVLISTAPNYTVDLFAFVFGNILGVGLEEVIVILGLGFVALGLIALFYKELVFYAFDPEMAAAAGLPTTFLHYLLLGLIGITTVVAMKVVGLVLVVAMLVTPAATATLLSNRFHIIMLLGAAFGTASALAGVYLSYYAGVASGATVVLVTTAFFIIALLLSPRTGLLRRSAPTHQP